MVFVWNSMRMFSNRYMFTEDIDSLIQSSMDATALYIILAVVYVCVRNDRKTKTNDNQVNLEYNAKWEFVITKNF